MNGQHGSLLQNVDTSGMTKQQKKKLKKKIKKNMNTDEMNNAKTEEYLNHNMENLGNQVIAQSKLNDD